MTPREVASLLAAAAALDGRIHPSPAAAELWRRLLADVPAEAAQQLLAEHYRHSTDVLMPAHLVRAYARRTGQLAPDPDEAWTAALRVASAGGEGRGLLHPAVEAAYAALGGAQGIANGSPSTTRAHFRDAYRPAAARHDELALARPLAQLPLPRGREELSS